MYRILSLSVALALLLIVSALPAAAHGSFWDDDGNPHEANIEAVDADGITQGCNELGDRYCPRDDVRRGQMAAFLSRALDLPPAERDHFADDDGSPFEDAIDAVAAAGIATGCAQDAFCPGDDVTRAQMASFLAAALDLPTAATDHFTDDEGSPHEANIDALAEEGVTEGCTADRYCPTNTVDRDQMASFLARGLGLEAPDPTTGSERTLTYTIGAEGDPDVGSMAIFGTRIHQALHGEGGWNIGGRLFFRYVEEGGDLHFWLTDDDAVGDRAPVCSDEWSCTVGDDLYINDQNFANPPPHWSDRLPDYQRYVVNHEAGHYLDFDDRIHYNDAAFCDPEFSGDAPVMMQQSKPTVMNGNSCDLNVWPLGFERDCVEEAWLPDDTTQSEECPQ